MPPKCLIRQQALEAGERFYQGVPCCHGHDGLRYTKNKACYHCAKIQRAKWHLENSEYHNELNKRWKENNLEKYREQGKKRCRARYAKVKKARIFLGDSRVMDMIKAVYNAKQHMEESLGVRMHVDHIIPLQGENVCGLHVPWNLQITSVAYNSSKQNKRLDDEVIYQNIGGTVIVHESALPWNVRSSL